MRQYFLLSLPLLFLNTISYAQTNVDFKKVSTCESDYFNGNFCSKNNIIKYKKALQSMKPNFNQTYILLNTGTAHSLEMVAIDTQTGVAYPLHYQYTGWEDQQGHKKKKPSYTFSLNHAKLCLMGSQYDGDHPGTHETYSNIKQCFELKKSKSSTHFETIYNDRIEYEYNPKNKTWIPFSQS